MNKFDVIIIGAGHAGLEAAFSCAKLNLKVALFTINKNYVANMPCNPSIGGPAKGVVTREIDALGGIQAIAADHCQLQMKLLNSSKGAGVWALRAQIDKVAYHKWFMNAIKQQSNITLVENEVIKIIAKDNQVIGIECADKTIYDAKAVIVTTGTFLRSITHIGKEEKSEGPNDQKNSNQLSQSLIDLGFDLIRLKTGTPPRIDKNSIDFSKMQIESGTNCKLSFSHFDPFYLNYDMQVPCHLIHTNCKMHDLIKNNLQRSAMYAGRINAIGPRYCPSIEDKIVRFSDKPRHQIFIEPESLSLNTMYLQGMSTSFDKQMQEQLVRLLPGLENAVFENYAYAIEYDAIDPTQLNLTYESKIIKNLYFAGQINGTSGYEEAAGQGLMAGINASLKLKGLEPLILKRSEAYIGVMTDDLITKGVTEPYRLLTSRAEHRLYLRNDNAQDRLIEYAKSIKMVDDKVYQDYLLVNSQVAQIINFLKENRVSKFKELSLNNPKANYSLYQLAKRPETNLHDLLHLVCPEQSFVLQAIDKANILIKYEGYINSQNKIIQKINKQSNVDLSQISNYNVIANLSLEAKDKLNKIKPLTLSQASRISGINLIDLAIIKYHLDHNKEK